MRFFLILLFLGSSLSGLGQNADSLINPIMAVMPKIIKIYADKGNGGLEIVDKVAPESLTTHDSNVTYYYSKINPTNSFEVRMLYEQLTTPPKYKWSVIVARELNRSSIDEGEMLGVYKLLSSRIKSSYPTLKIEEDLINIKGQYSKNIQRFIGNQSVIELELWHETRSRRNMVRICVHAL
jgi:hypothetical protein